MATTGEAAGDRPLRDALRALRVERRRTADERAAFDAFHDRVRSIAAADGRPATTGGPADHLRPGLGDGIDPRARPGPGGGLVAVRRAYEATVMSVPHYDAEYGDTYPRSLAAEFGPELAAALTRGTAFEAEYRRALLAKAAEARELRGRFVDALDDERESLTGASVRLARVEEAVAGIEAAAFGTATFGELDAHRARLESLSDRCDAVAADRQAAIRHGERALGLPDAPPDLPAYLYGDLPERYPVLARIGDLGDRIRRQEDALAAAAGEPR
jgi:hypothetical protein